ncbi:hypothetical protein F4804DRAFT_354196 [Jackrogersella minutella]|nr:hypothetical protein F4804DRAFT_354196 [Jackrogersella minutella]
MAADGTNSPAFGDSQLQETKASSSFQPLPPIRRTSTFDILSRKKLGAEEEDETPSPVGSSDNEVPPVPPIKEGMSYQNGNGHVPGQGQGNQPAVYQNQPQNFTQSPPLQQHPTFADGPPQNPNGFAAGSGAPQVNGFQQQQQNMYMGRGGPMGPPHQFGQMPGQPGPSSMQNPGSSFISQMAGNGNPIQKFPVGGGWKLEESHLTEPLIQHKPRGGANSPTQHPGYNDEYDKETEDPPPSAKGQILTGTRPRNNSNSIPPVSAERFRKHGIFVPHEQSQAGPPHQTGHPPFRGGPNDSAHQGGMGYREAGPSKEMDVHIDEVSVSSTASEERPSGSRRGSGIFNLGQRRNTGAEQGSDQNAAGKEKSSFFGGGANLNKFQVKQKSNLGPPRASTFDHENNPEHASMKKRLSELTGMIKGVGNAKDGAKDDQPAKPSTAYPPPRPSIPGPTRSQPGQSSPLAGIPLGMERSSTGGSRPPEGQQAQGDDGREKKPIDGFLGRLFNKQGSKPAESKQPNQQTPPPPPGQRLPQQFSTQPSRFGPGQMPPPGQPFGPMFFGQQQPLMHGGLQGQHAMQQPMLLPGQPNPRDHITSPASPQFLGTAEAVLIRRPSEITVSQNQPGGTPLPPGQRPQFEFQQGPQANIRPPTVRDSDARNVNRQLIGDDVFSAPGPISRDSPHRSRPSSPDVSVSPFANRSTPNRKPVGSGFMKQDGASPISQHTRNPMQPTKPNDPSPQTETAEDEGKLSSQPPSGQQSPTLGKSGHVRQTSLPSPGRPLIIPQPGQVTFQPVVGGAQVPHRGPMSPSQDRQPSGQPQEISQRQRGMSQPVQRPAGYLPSPSGSNPQYSPGQIPQPWGPNFSYANPQRPGQLQNANGPPRFVGMPALPPDQDKTIKKFFGDDSKNHNFHPTQPQKESKEKSAASKLLSAFKRGSKQSNPNQSPQPQRPPPGHHTPPQTARPQQGNQPVKHQPISGPSPTGPVGPMGIRSQGPLPPGQGRGVPMPPGPFSPDHMHHHHPVMTGVGRGAPPPQAQAGRGQNPQVGGGGLTPQALGQQRRKSAQNLEPQYDQVPIPRGYEAVHGYGNAGTIATSPYNVGRPSPPPASHRQFQSFGPQGAPQQWDPRAMPGPGQHPGQLQPSHSPSTQRLSDSESGTPTPSEQGTFLDMAPTPPQRPSQDEARYDRQAPPPVPAQFLRNQPSLQLQQGRQKARPPQVQVPEAQTPSSSNWGSAPDSARSPHSQRKVDAPIPGTALQSKPSDPNMSPPSDSDDAQRPHIATTMNSSAAHPHPDLPALQNNNNNTPPPNGTRPFSPTGGPAPRPLVNAPGQEQATRLVSKMAAAAEPPRKNASLSPDLAAMRAASVSPEPPGPPRQPFHQVSNASLNINVDRANDLRDADDDIYDATPRGGSSSNNNNNARQQDENTKYAGSVAGAAVAAATIVVMDGPASEDSSFSQKEVSSNMDSEEKILVEQPVELAAVNDDDDGMPVMSATSYPGQEWNPYGAGEFGDYE